MKFSTRTEKWTKQKPLEKTKTRNRKKRGRITCSQASSTRNDPIWFRCIRKVMNIHIPMDAREWITVLCLVIAFRWNAKEIKSNQTQNEMRMFAFRERRRALSCASSAAAATTDRACCSLLFGSEAVHTIEFNVLDCFILLDEPNERCHTNHTNSIQLMFGFRTKWMWKTVVCNHRRCCFAQFTVFVQLKWKYSIIEYNFHLLLFVSGFWTWFFRISRNKCRSYSDFAI